MRRFDASQLSRIPEIRNRQQVFVIPHAGEVQMFVAAQVLSKVSPFRYQLVVDGVELIGRRKDLLPPLPLNN